MRDVPLTYRQGSIQRPAWNQQQHEPAGTQLGYEGVSMKVTSNGPITAARQRAHGVPADPTVRLAIKFRKLNRSILNNDFYGAKTMVSEVYDQAAIIADFD